jgi:hypothetical protein
MMETEDDGIGPLYDGPPVTREHWFEQPLKSGEEGLCSDCVFGPEYAFRACLQVRRHQSENITGQLCCEGRVIKPLSDEATAWLIYVKLTT